MWSVHASKQASKQASKHTSIHTHARNEVTLVWGSLRLAPIKQLTLSISGVGSADKLARFVNAQKCIDWLQIQLNNTLILKKILHRKWYVGVMFNTVNANEY